MTTLIARTVVRTAVPLILLTAVAALIAGHNRPGGGFIAGVLVAAAITLIYIVYGRTALERGLGTTPETYERVAAVGLALAFGGGVGAVALGAPFLDQGVLFVALPVGPIEVASALVFDLGVFGVVSGALLAVVSRLGREGE